MNAKNWQLGLSSCCTGRADRDLTFKDFIDNYTACVNKQIIAPIGTPDLAVCAKKAYFDTPKISE